MQKYSIQILTQLSELIGKLNSHQYTGSLDLLSQNSIGKHTRHIIEFYHCVFDGLESGVINYDKRQRNALIENDTEYAILALNKICEKLDSIKSDCSICLQLSFSNTNPISEMQSSYFRELAYNCEHAVHHLAIIKIAVNTHFREVKLPEHFGVAYSTQLYNQQN